jgi:hypothetical protein
MERIDMVFEYRGFNIHVFRGLPNEIDLNWNEEIKFTITKASEEIKGTLCLKPLWFIDDDERDDPTFEYKNKYTIGDYFQQTFITEPTRKGIGSVLHEFIIENRLRFSFNNVFSTNVIEDWHAISSDASSFWEKRTELKKAIKDDELNRHKILFTLARVPHKPFAAINLRFDKSSITVSRTSE